MFAKNWTYKLLGVFILALAVAGLGGCGVSAQMKADTATASLKILSESITAIHAAIVRELIKGGADVNVENKYVWTPLVMAHRRLFTTK